MSVRPAKTQISLGMRQVWSESSLSAWRKLGSLATHWAHSEDPDQTGRMPRLIWVFAGCTATLLVLSCRGSLFYSMFLFLLDHGRSNILCFETVKNTKAFECFFTGFQHSLWKFSTTGNLYSLKSWLWLAAVACVVRWPISNAFLKWYLAHMLYTNGQRYINITRNTIGLKSGQKDCRKF